MNQPPPLDPLFIPPRDPNAPRPTEAEIDAEMARLDGINGSGGHHLGDPYLRGLIRQQIAGDLSGDEVRQLGEAWIAEKDERERRTEERRRRIIDIRDRMWPDGMPALQHDRDEQSMNTAEAMSDLLAVPALPGEVQCDHGFHHHNGPHSCDWSAHGDRCPAES